MAELARLTPETLQFVLIFLGEVLAFTQTHFGIVMLLAVFLVLFIGLVARLTCRLFFAR